MIKLIFMLKRKAGMSPDAFRDHYEQVHVPMARRYIGHLLSDYRRNYPQLAVRNPSAQGDDPSDPVPTPYDAVAEMWLADQAAVAEMTRIFNDPEISPVLNADQLEFLEPDQTLMLVCEEVSTGTAASD
jgi:uncharacterized protein (TIGR02118 family)